MHEYPGELREYFFIVLCSIGNTAAGDTAQEYCYLIKRNGDLPVFYQAMIQYVLGVVRDGDVLLRFDTAMTMLNHISNNKKELQDCNAYSFQEVYDLQRGVLQARRRCHLTSADRPEVTAEFPAKFQTFSKGSFKLQCKSLIGKFVRACSVKNAQKEVLQALPEETFSYTFGGRSFPLPELEIPQPPADNRGPSDMSKYDLQAEKARHHKLNMQRNVSTTVEPGDMVIRATQASRRNAHGLKLPNA